jgi:hypothetical protein
MGTGIMGVIPVSFSFMRGRWEGDAMRYKQKFCAHAAEGTLGFYNEKTRTGRDGKETTYYEIKTELLFPQFKDFFFEFNRLIGEEKVLENCDKFNEEYDAIIASNDLKRFMAHFDNDDGYNPLAYSAVDVLYIEGSHSLLIYRGSYKAMLEEYTTFDHMERMLAAAMKNPLAKVVRFGMSL